MNFNEHVGKSLLAVYGIPVPVGEVVETVQDAVAAAAKIGPVVVKAQVPIGKRGKSGGVRVADTSEEAKIASDSILGMAIGENIVKQLLIEEKKPIDREFYAAILTDATSKGPMVLFSPYGGVDVESVEGEKESPMKSINVDIRQGLSSVSVLKMLAELDLGGIEKEIADIILKLYEAYLAVDAELLEINPLGLCGKQLVALDCKFTMDDSSAKRQKELATQCSPEQLTDLEKKAKLLGLNYIELDGDVGVLANGAGLTMTTMDVVRNYGGKPCNFLEIGGEAYIKSKEALTFVLKNRKIKSLVINFCGAFARTDVMTEGIINAIDELRPDLPIFWSVHGTGDKEATKMLKKRLGVEPLSTMDAACKAAVVAASKY
ncbi:MAG: Succinyl-CoA ligase [ADP-forming] subunit beta [Alphaproteobacteria bacterium MarineAlpha3_Bin5]|nr:succinate--CoA ligase [Magnetovibrio sp.]PPR78056.1 MAG: Succinyl-CoA ligase [ADP-forming] subunit beta [Alphaproteobacteria bacterium MarineAlpha3_Bin5]